MSNCNARNLKVIFGDFTEGADSFELVSSFCYKNGKVEINPTNIAFLHSAARYLEMRDPVSGVYNLVGEMRKVVEEIRDWTGSDLMSLLKQCQELNLVTTLSGSSFLKKCLSSVVGKVALSGEPSLCPSTASSNRSGMRFSCKMKSTTATTDSLKSSFSRGTWCFEDLLFVNVALLERLGHSMISQKFDRGVISKFLFCYHISKSQFVKQHEKCENVDAVVDLLYVIERGSVLCKSLGLDGCRRTMLEIIVSSRMDEATMDNLLIQSPAGTNHLDDFTLFLRLFTAFLNEQSNRGYITQLQKVTSRLDAYLVELAPDPCPKAIKIPPEFLTLMYIKRWMDMYMEDCPMKTLKMCRALNNGKLFAKAYNDLSRNTKSLVKKCLPSPNFPLPCNWGQKQGENRRKRAPEADRSVCRGVRTPIR